MLNERLAKLMEDANDSFDKAQPIVEQFLRSAEGMDESEFGAMLAMVIEVYCNAMNEDAVEYARKLATKIEFTHIMLEMFEQAVDEKMEGKDE